MLPVQRCLDKPRINLEFRRWLRGLWKERVKVYERHMKHAVECREQLGSFSALLPVGTNVAVELDPQNKAEYPDKFGPLYMGPWVVVKRSTNGKTYWERDLGSEQERQVTREQSKIIRVLSTWKREAEPVF